MRLPNPPHGVKVEGTQACAATVPTTSPEMPPLMGGVGADDALNLAPAGGTHRALVPVGAPAGPPAHAGADTRVAGPANLYARWVRPALGAALVATISAPVAAAVAVVAAVQLAVYRSASEVFFVQTRAGQHGAPFRILKFRTMRPDAATGEVVPTRLGRLLRRSHLDELPQLWNVIRGEMSLIGPRPETLDLEAWGEKEVPGFRSRLVRKPGITGLAQVVQDSTPQKTDLYREKLRLNQVYESSLSLRLDLWILFRTAVRPVRPRTYPVPPLKGM